MNSISTFYVVTPRLGVIKVDDGSEKEGRPYFVAVATFWLSACRELDQPFCFDKQSIVHIGPDTIVLAENEKIEYLCLQQIAITGGIAALFLSLRKAKKCVRRFGRSYLELLPWDYRYECSTRAVLDEIGFVHPTFHIDDRVMQLCSEKSKSSLWSRTKKT